MTNGKSGLWRLLPKPKNLDLRTGQTGLISRSRPESDQDMIYVKCTTIDFGLLDNIMDVKQLSKT